MLTERGKEVENLLESWCWKLVGQTVSLQHKWEYAQLRKDIKNWLNVKVIKNKQMYYFVKAKPWTVPCSGTRCWWWRTTRGCQRWCDWWRPLDRWLSQQGRRRQGRRAIGCSIGKRTRRCSPPQIDRGEWDGLRKESQLFEWFFYSWWCGKRIFDKVYDCKFFINN